MKKILVLLVALTMLVSCTPAQEPCDMAIEFDFTQNQGVNFGSDASLDDIDHKLVSFWFFLDSFQGGSAGMYLVEKNTAGPVGWHIRLLTGSERIAISQTFSGTDGVWATDNNTIVIQTLYHIAIEYDNSSAANDPKIWINNVPENVNEIGGVPSGTAESDAAANFFIGNRDHGVNKSLDGWQSGVRMHNLSGFTTAEIDALISDLYNGREAGGNSRGIVFNCPTAGASGLQSYDGATLGASNKLFDIIAGVAGTPANSPLGRADTVLTFR